MAQAPVAPAPALKVIGQIVDQQAFNALTPPERLKYLHLANGMFAETVDLPPPPAPPASPGSNKGLTAGALAVACFATVLAIAAFFFPTTDGFVSSDDVAGVVKGEIAKLKPAKVGIDDVEGLKKALDDAKASASKAPTAGNPGDLERSDKPATTAGGITQNVTVCVGGSCTDAIGKPAAKPTARTPTRPVAPQAPAAAPATKPAASVPQAAAGGNVVCAWINPDTKVRYDRPEGTPGQCIDWVKEISKGFTNTRKISD